MNRCCANRIKFIVWFKLLLCCLFCVRKCCSKQARDSDSWLPRGIEGKQPLNMNDCFLSVFVFVLWAHNAPSPYFIPFYLISQPLSLTATVIYRSKCRVFPYIDIFYKFSIRKSLSYQSFDCLIYKSSEFAWLGLDRHVWNVIKTTTKTKWQLMMRAREFDWFSL